MIQIIFDEEKDRREGYIDCCHIIIDDHGIKQQKVIRTETLYELLEKTKEHKKKETFSWKSATRISCNKTEN